MEDIFSRPRDAYIRALQLYGPVIAVRRKGNLEYIVGAQYARHVLTCDHLFSFEAGSAAIMNLRPIMALTGGTLFRDLQDFVRDGIISRIDDIVSKIYPIYDRDARRFLDHSRQTAKGGIRPDSFRNSRDTVAETTLILLLGQDYVNRRNTEIIENVSNGMAELTGQFQNMSLLGRYLPWFWVFLTWVNVMLIKIPFGFMCLLGPQLWEDVSRYEALASSRVSPEHEPKNVLYLITKTYARASGRGIGIFRRLYIALLLLCLIFASVHTTTVVSQWVFFQLAVHPEYLEPLREELLRIREEDEDGSLRLTAASLREAHLLDSFIREVMRLKGDTIATMRYTTCDAPLGEYVIPKGSFVTPMSCAVHENPGVFGDDPTDFNGFQWAELNKEASMTGAAHIVFGLGRFACPGRVLAVNEIKLIILCLIGRATPSLLEGKFVVTDPLNTVTQPPKGTLIFTPLESPLL
ncbi:cytochrome P450 [Wolfiporia cocos MD-104 SS10]|uniref:Cytochrome P450 n=1 Tax=Wolfiporia cocos (strain MD-104) TaxID=742152 RepID=A0A2H3JCC0_WOLCO|nr:cytochrome P450 [Wolfiporia cocos MD-104 SS10]